MGKFLLTFSMLLGGLSTSLAQDYYQDAVQLSARIAAQSNDNADIPANYTAELTVALEAVARSSHETAHTVTQKLAIHTFSYANTQEFRLYIDADVDWALRLAKDEVEIEQTPLRSLALLHGLSLDHVKYLNGIVMLAIRSEQPKNMRYFANKLSLEEGVIMAEIPAPSGHGHDITAKRYKEGWVITYHYNYFHCDTGCQKSFSWRFGVSNAGEVDFMGSFGEMPQELIDEDIFVMETN